MATLCVFPRIGRAPAAQKTTKSDVLFPRCLMQEHATIAAHPSIVG